MLLFAYRLIFFIIFVVMTFIVPIRLFPLLMESGISPTLVPETGIRGIIEDLAYLLFIVVLSSLMIFFLARFRRLSLLSLLFSFFSIFLSFMAPYSILSLIVGEGLLSILVSMTMPMLWLIAFRLEHPKVALLISSILVMLTGSLSGLVFTLLMPLYVVILFLIVLSLYDYISVRSGPLKRLMELVPLSRDKGSISSLKGTPLFFVTAYIGIMNIGIGDIMSYTMLSCISLFLIGIHGAVFSFLLLLSGLFITYLIMTRMKLKYAPGLPLPLLMGLLALAIFKAL
ncbi:MAG: hypothetical protein J7L11_07125 [Thermoprotei archaeon]|nr:hypothetical protein [Thermoprotei archaeon]